MAEDSTDSDKTMADISTVRQAFESYLKDYWSYTPVAWDNVPFTAPEKGSWIRPAVVVDFSENVNIGSILNSRERHSGNYIIQLFSPLNEGTGDHTRLIDDMIKLLTNKQIEQNILTYAGSPRRIGDEGNGWYQSNILIPFTADQQGSD